MTDGCDCLPPSSWSRRQLAGRFPAGQLEVYDWGTFDGRVSTLLLHGDERAAHGDIGSGKSDAGRCSRPALLVPSNKISYNKAAGADTRERDLRSYVLGHYKCKQIESTGASPPSGCVTSVLIPCLLGVFRNEGLDEEVTLAQVFWVKDTSAGQPQRYFVTAPRALTIVRDFSSFGTDINVLKAATARQRGKRSGHFPAYGQQARRLLGIHSEQAMELFHQTVWLKSWATSTTRTPPYARAADPNSKIASLVAHFQHPDRRARRRASRPRPARPARAIARALRHPPRPAGASDRRGAG